MTLRPDQQMAVLDLVNFGWRRADAVKAVTPTEETGNGELCYRELRGLAQELHRRAPGDDLGRETLYKLTKLELVLAVLRLARMLQWLREPVRAELWELCDDFDDADALCIGDKAISDEARQAIHDAGQLTPLEQFTLSHPSFHAAINRLTGSDTPPTSAE